MQKNKTLNIKTITCHNVYNYGASLQEYALLHYLKSLGHNVETIKYNPDYLSGHFNFWAVSNPKYNKNIILKYAYLLAKLPSRIFSLKRKYNFDKFSDKYIKSTKENYTSNDELKNNLPDADVYICGSDQIWNSFFQNGKDPAFYLDFVPKDKLKISYAASFATDKIEDSLKDFVKDKVSRINVVSVRETSGLEILKDLDIIKAKQVLDPVFLLEKKYWENQFVYPINEKYIFIYDFDSNKSIMEIAKTISKKNNLKIYTVNKNIKYADKNFWLKGPETFLSLIANADLVLSNSFHAVAFSLIFNKQFYVFNRSEKINTRMRDLLELVNASYLLIDNNSNINQINKQPIDDYNKINNFIKIAVTRSKLFLKKALQ
ncbi:MAG TPA: polysaccharide pyruvyl transferase family protein [Flavobacteriaceae bacterium]|nr:polysaccharide pyruvyl transferase family protein [Flavobacteriaceae bacterium]